MSSSSRDTRAGFPGLDVAAIIGPGLLGASLGLAIKALGLAREVRGIGRRQSTLDVALDRGAIDSTFLEVADGVRDAGLVVVCTPAGSVPGILDQVRQSAPETALVTDVASTKGTICRHASDTWPRPRRFIGSHPMAGSHEFGPEHATAKLYEGQAVLVETGDDLDANAREQVCLLWESVGARVVGVTPDQHDAIVARTSHGPHVIAAAVAMSAVKDLDASALMPFIGGGFRDVTRIAAGRSELWRDICLTNAEPVSSMLSEVRRRLEQFSALLQAGDADALEQFFEAGRVARASALGDAEDRRGGQSGIGFDSAE